VKLAVRAAKPKTEYKLPITDDKELAMITLNVNGKSAAVDADPSTPILWALRDNLGLTGTKFGCGMALCGACTVHVDGQAVRSCVTPISAAAGKRISTVEVVTVTDKVGKAVSDAWVKHDVAQCGYCQSGQIMSASALLATNKSPSDADIDAAMAGNVCRCGTYQRIRAAIKDAARALA
jgi:isoquinoline 1-oxidoreductase subunit alpha